MIHGITFSEYVQILDKAKKEFSNVALNVSTPEDKKGNKYFKSLEGC